MAEILDFAHFNELKILEHWDSEEGGGTSTLKINLMMFGGRAPSSVMIVSDDENLPRGHMYHLNIEQFEEMVTALNLILDNIKMVK